jgi:hypothetical protein
VEIATVTSSRVMIAGGDEGTQRWPVHHVDRDAARHAGGVQRGQLGLGRAGGDREGDAIQEFRREARTPPEHGAGAQQQRRLRLQRLARAHQQDASTLKVKEGGKMPHQAGSNARVSGRSSSSQEPPPVPAAQRTPMASRLCAHCTIAATTFAAVTRWQA